MLGVMLIGVHSSIHVVFTSTFLLTTHEGRQLSSIVKTAVGVLRPKFQVNMSSSGHNPTEVPCVIT